MSARYQVPFHLCQWCYKTTGRFMLDCLCVVCQSCFNTKKDWFSEQGKCFCCDKNSTRKCIDLKVNPQAAGNYFQNVNSSIKSIVGVQQFQHDVSRKYCRYLQKKVNRFETIIKTFLSQFPQYGSFFESASKQYLQKQNASVRSKSLQSQLNSIPNNRMLYPSHTQKNIIVRNQIKIGKYEEDMTPNHPKSVNPQYIEHSKKAYKYSPGSNKMKQTSHISTTSNQYQNQKAQPYLVKKAPTNQAPRNNQAYSKGNNFRQNPDKYMMPNPEKKSIQVPNNQNYQQQGGFPIYKMGGTKKLSDPTKQINLKNINMQTAMRSIRSQDQKGAPPYYPNNSFESRRKLVQRNNNQFDEFQDPYEDVHPRRQCNVFHQKRFQK